MMVIASVGSYWLNGLLAKARYGEAASMNFEAVNDEGYLGSPYRAARVFGATIPERVPRTRSSRAVKLRAIGDVGSHWMDLAQFVTGQRIVSVCADLATMIPVRRRPVGEVQTFSKATDVERVDVAMSSEDIGHVLVHFDGGARGAFKVSQLAAGRRNHLHVEVDGSQSSLYWDAERHEELWLGNRDAPNGLLQRNAALMHPDAASRTRLPAGHAEGWVETFRELYRAVYAAVATGSMPDTAGSSMVLTIAPRRATPTWRRRVRTPSGRGCLAAVIRPSRPTRPTPRPRRAGRPRHPAPRATRRTSRR